MIDGIIHIYLLTIHADLPKTYTQKLPTKLGTHIDDKGAQKILLIRIITHAKYAAIE